MNANVKVVSLQRHRNRALVAVCRELLQHAEDGDLQGLCFVGKFGRGDHRAGLAGDYKRNPSEALTATFMMERFLTDELPPVFEESEF
jgi:hypothetical protein